MQPPDYRELVDLGGTVVTIRTMRPVDSSMEDDFVRELSPRTRYSRFHSALKQLSASMLERFTNVDYPDQMALIATVSNGAVERQIGVARYARSTGADWAEVAVVVADAWQEKGVGSRLLISLRHLAHQAGVKHLEVSVLPDNTRMLTLAKKLGFRVRLKYGDSRTIELGKDLDGD